MKVRKKFSNRMIAACMILFVGVIAFSTNVYAETPTIEDIETRNYKTLTIGKNQMTMKNYDAWNDTLIGCFVAPETGKYSITISNNGSDWSNYYLLKSDLSTWKYCKSIDVSKKATFENLSLKKNQKIYVHIESDWGHQNVLAANVTIKQTTVAPQLNKKAVSLASKKKVTLKLKNAPKNKKIIWVSSNKKVATVTSKGVVKAKKKGTAYIYAICNNKLYRCKISVYR